jgi:O-antigen ligase
MRVEAVRPHDLVIMSALAVVLALGVTLVKPTVGLQIAIGFVILLVAFSSARAALYLLIFSMLLSPEIAIGRLEGRGVGGREISIRFDDLLLIIIGFTWLVKTIIYRELALIKHTPINRPIVYYMVACILATLVGLLTGRVRPVTGFFFLLKYFEYFFIFFMVVNNVSTREQMVHLIIALLATAFLISLYAIGQIPSGERASAPFEGEAGEPNTLGGYLVFIMAVSMGLLLHVRGVAVRWMLVGLLGLLTLALMATLSRTSYLAAGVLVLAVVATQWRRPAVVVTVLVLALLVPVVAPANVKQRVHETFFGQKYGGEVSVVGVTVDLSTSERLKSWALVLRDWAQRPLLGYGITGYAWADAQYVKILGETGLVGLLAFGFMSVRLWRKARDAFLAEEDPVCKGIAHGFLLGLVAMLAHGLGANTFIIIRIMEPFWLCAGLVVALPALHGKVQGTGAAQVPA